MCVYISISFSISHLFNYYYYCGREGSEHNVKPIGLVRGWIKAHSCANQNLTRRRSLRKANVKTMLDQDKYANRGPRMGWTHCLRSLRNNCTSGCPSCPPTPKSRTPWKTSETCKQRREVRGWTEAHSCANKNLTCRRSLRKADVKTMLDQAKYVNRDPRMGNRRTHCLRNDCTSGCLNCAPTPKSKTPWKTLKMCKQRREVRGWTKAHSYANQNLTCRRSLRKANVKTMLDQAKYANRDPRMGNGRTHCPRNDCTSGCPNCPPAPKSRTPWKTLETCKQRREEIFVEDNHHLHV